MNVYFAFAIVVISSYIFFRMGRNDLEKQYKNSLSLFNTRSIHGGEKKLVLVEVDEKGFPVGLTSPGIKDCEIFFKSAPIKD